MSSILRNPPAPPSPTQDGMLPQCTAYMQAFAKDDTCSWFAGRANMLPKFLYQYNPLLGVDGKDCPLQFWANYWYCVGTSAASGPTSTLVTVTQSTPASVAAQDAQITSAPPATTPVAGVSTVSLQAGSSAASSGTASASPLPSSAPASSASPASSSSSSPAAPAPASCSPAASAPPNPKQPAPNQGAAYIGCVSEYPGRALTMASTVKSDMTIGQCLGFCSNMGFPLSGLEYGSECYCGKALPAVNTNYSPNIEANDKAGACGMACAGDKGQFCGGSNLISVWQNSSIPYAGSSAASPSANSPSPATSSSSPLPSTTRTITPTPSSTTPAKLGPTMPAKINDWTYLGCFDESKGRVLSAAMIGDDALTPARCVAYCGGKGYKYGGVEYARECWCGAGLGAGVTKLDESRCGMPCKGDAGLLCGGSGAIGVFGKGVSKAKRDHNGGHGGDGVGEPLPVGEQVVPVTKVVRMVRRGRYVRRHHV